MFHYVSQIVANFVCQLFGAGQVVYSGLITACCSQQLPAAGNSADESSERESKLGLQLTIIFIIDQSVYNFLD